MRRRTALAAAVSAVVLGVPALPGSAAAPCAVDLEQRNTWHPVVPTGAVAMQDDDPCRLLGVGPGDITRTSDDGGAHWQVVGTSPTEPASLVTAGLPGGSGLLVGTDGSVWRTSDRGRAWSRASGVSGVRKVVADDGRRVYALTAPAATGLPVTLPVGTAATLYRSTDGGRTFAEMGGALDLAVSAVVPDAVSPTRLWIGVGGPAGGVYVSDDDGGTFTRVANGDVTALATSKLVGGGGELVAATSDGLVVTRDAGATFTSHQHGAFSGVAVEWRHPSALMLLGSTVLRSSNTGGTVSQEAFGLPASCHATDLRRDRSVPSVFLTTCSDGATWRYRSDGTDLSSIDDPNASSGVGVNNLGPPTPMRELARHPVPIPGSRSDGSIAFDGYVLYYSDGEQHGIVHRMRASDGARLPDLRTTITRGLGHLAYDANRDHLLALDRSLVVWDIDLHSGKATKLFHSPLNGSTEEQDSGDPNGTFYYGSMTFDSSTDRLLFASDSSDSYTEFDRQGHQVGACPDLGLGEIVKVVGQPSTSASIAALVATGDGETYVESEDDSYVLRVDRSCRVVAEFQHEQFSEAPNENDAMACDTTTFDTPAIWLRDASEARVVAYAVPSGYCALPSSVAVSAPAAVATGSSGRVCAHLISRGKRLPIAGQRIDLLVAGRGIASPSTDVHGTACARYEPLSREAGAGSGSARTRQPVVAAFLGTPAYRPATARASTLVSRSVLPLPVPPPPVPPQPPLPVVHPAPVVVAVPPPPPVQPPPPPPNVPQQQPIAQSHPGAQPGAMGALGSAPVPEGEEEAAAQTADTHLMTGLETAAVGAVLMWVVARRRREARVRPATR